MTEFQLPKPIIRPLPEEIAATTELLLRLPDTLLKDHHYYAQQLISIEAGYRGECKLDRTLEMLPLPSLHTVYANYHTKSKVGLHYQIDTLVVTSRYVLLIEVKNIRGHLRFESNPDRLLRTFEDQTEELRCPLSQTERNADYIRKQVHKIAPHLPVIPIIVFTHSTCRILTTQQRIQLLYRRQLEPFVERLNQKPSLLDKKQFQQLSRLFKSTDKNFLPESLLSRSGMQADLLRKGIFCSSCRGDMKLTKTFYTCASCGHIDTSALKRSIIGLFGIAGPHLSIRILKYHLMIEKKNRVIRVLNSLPVSRTGNARASYYTLLRK